ncbi:hypothetical protein NLU13_6791 [Sarocladium strictum]|uniref:Uncharacterized protein n=1 Tax=Sarocladium strictum TaxID=5046 RepID=A0AA39GFJ1_SARSR|nr:hypothetical protein NLU13_6791 [Sarocladium strictum]
MNDHLEADEQSDPGYSHMPEEMLDQETSFAMNSASENFNFSFETVDADEPSLDPSTASFMQGYEFAHQMGNMFDTANAAQSTQETFLNQDTEMNESSYGDYIHLNSPTEDDNCGYFDESQLLALLNIPPSDAQTGETSFSTLVPSTPISTYGGQDLTRTAPGAPMTPMQDRSASSKRFSSPQEDDNTRPHKKPLVLHSGPPQIQPQQPVDDQLKANYIARNLAFSPAKIQRSSKVADAQVTRISTDVPWRQEFVDGKRRKTKIFIGYAKNIIDARRADEAWRAAHSHGHPRTTTTPASDDTFPDLSAQGTDPKYLVLCSQIFYAICDWDRISEWNQVIEPSKRDELLDEIYHKRIAAGYQGLKGASVEELRPSDERLAGLIPDADDQHYRLMGTPFPEDYIVEQMSFNLIDAAIDAQQGKLNVQPLQERVDAIAQTLRTSKQVYKSLRGSALSWVHRVASQPMHEAKSKRNNTVVNFAKNRRAKEATKITQAEWQRKMDGKKESSSEQEEA